MNHERNEQAQKNNNKIILQINSTNRSTDQKDSQD